jgi:hypothetical protein
MPSIIKVDQIQSDTGNVTFTGNIAFPAGSATLPSIQPVGDTNTGIFFPAADTIAFAEGGVESGRFNSSGNFGLGTSSPSSSYIVRFLHVSDATSAGIVFSGPRKFSAYSTSSSSFIIIDDDASGATRLGIDSSGNLSFNSGYGSAATAYGCRAWVNFNGTGTPAARASGNVSSITDDGTGLFRVNFSTSMPDANYCITMSVQEDVGGGMRVGAGRSTQTAGSAFIEARNSSNSLVDPANFWVAVFR